MVAPWDEGKVPLLGRARFGVPTLHTTTDLGDGTMQGTHLLAQMLGLLPRPLFDASVASHQGDKGSKGITCWDVFCTMLFAQLSGTDSLREICQGLKTHHGKLPHMRQGWVPNTSSLAYTLAHRPWQIFSEFHRHLVEAARRECIGRRRIAELEQGVFSIDSTSIDLCLSVFPWAKFRARKGAVKVHTVLENSSSLPVFAHVTDGATSDLRGLREGIIPQFPLPAGSIVVLDRGYCDYGLWNTWTTQGVLFVSRMKDTSGWTCMEERELPEVPGPPSPEDTWILQDREIVLATASGFRKCPHRLRLVDAEVWAPKGGRRRIQFVTNDLNLAATQIAALYRDRWQVELLFKRIKQNLRITSFVGTSANAVKTQIYCALCAIVLTEILRSKARRQLAVLRQERLARSAEAGRKGSWTAGADPSKASMAYSNFMALLRLSLFAYRDLMEWLANPFPEPKRGPENDGLGPLFGQQDAAVGCA